MFDGHVYKTSHAHLLIGLGAPHQHFEHFRLTCRVQAALERSPRKPLENRRHPYSCNTRKSGCWTRGKSQRPSGA